MLVPLNPGAYPAAREIYLGQTLVQTHEVRVDIATAAAWTFGFGAVGAFMVYAAVLTVSELGLSFGTALLAGAELAVGLAFLVAGYGWIAAELGRRKLRRLVDGLEVHYGLEVVELRRGGQVERTLPLAEGLDHPLGRFAPFGLERLLAMRALLVGQPAEAPLRHAAEFAAWASFDAERHMPAQEVYVLRNPTTGQWEWFDLARDEDGDLSAWHAEGVSVFRVRLEKARHDPSDDQDVPESSHDRFAVVELPTLVDNPAALVS